MADFDLYPDKVRKSSWGFNDCYNKISKLQERIGIVKQSISGNSSLTALKSTIGIMEGDSGKHARSVYGMHAALSSCILQYEGTEASISGKSIGIFKGAAQIIAGKKGTEWIYLTSEQTKDWKKREWELYLARYQGNDKAQEYIIGLAASVGVVLNAPGYKDDKAFGEIKRGDKYGKTLKDAHWVRDKDGQYSIPELTEYAKKKATIAEVGVEGNIEGKVYGKSWGNDNANAEVTIGKAEVHGSVKAGLYGYDKYGKKKFAPAITAELGSSVCVANLKGQAKVGDDMLGAGVEGDVSLLKAEAKGTASAKLLTQDGKFNPELKASASAEAIAAEAKGSANVNVLGVKGTVNGSLNLGIGAHADIGIVDGKIKCDIGASLGIGASIGFEIDTKPLVKAACSLGKALWPKNWFK